MDATAARPSLLNAARNFIRKSAGTAVVVIAPLAAVSMVNSAKAQVVFGGAQSSGFNFSASSGSGALISYSPSGFFSISGGNGVRFGNSATIYNSGGGYLSGTVNMSFFSVFGGPIPTSGALPVGSSVPVSYNFTLTPTGTVAISSWTLNIYVTDQSEVSFHQQITDSSVGNISGSTFLTVNSTDNPNGLPNVNGYFGNLFVTFASFTPGDSLTIAMDKNIGQGISFNVTAIPEPSTYAALAGLGALGFVYLARRRGAKHRTAGTSLTV